VDRAKPFDIPSEGQLIDPIARGSVGRCYSAASLTDFCRRVALCRHAIEPREDDRDAAANCSVRRKRTPRAREESRLLVRQLSGGQLRSLSGARNSFRSHRSLQM
jgi:hypothetical protein